MTLSNKVRLLAILVVSLAVQACGQTARMPFDPHHLGDHSLRISTKNREAQLAFDNGLTLAYAFSYAAAEREFRRAAELDPAAAMPWWGVALVNGPHINYPLVPPKNAEVAWDGLLRASERAGRTSQLERDLIEALADRYVQKQGQDRSELDRRYARAMKAVWERHPKSADIGVLYAEALMDLHPWDLWTGKGEPKEWTPEILAILERSIALNPKHPGALHLYIHSIEASNTPERGAPAADALGGLVPASVHEKSRLDESIKAAL